MTENLTLAGEFAPQEYEQWIGPAEAALRGRPLESLTKKTYDGIAVKPLYTAADWDGTTDASGFPGAAPFTRGDHAEPRGWVVAQRYAQPDLGALMDAIRLEQTRGVQAVELQLDEAARLGLDPSQAEAEGKVAAGGAPVYTSADIKPIVQAAKFSLSSGPAFLGAAAIALAAAKEAGAAQDQLHAELGADPLGALANSGVMLAPMEESLAAAGDLAAYTHAHWPKVRALRVDTSAYHRAGATEVQDLSCSIATGVAYLEAAMGAGLSVEQAAGQLVFHFSVGCNFFSGIAKLRAARRLWGRVLEAAGAPQAAAQMQVQVSTADRMLSQRDPWVNILRTTVSGFAAAVGGADEIIVRPFDAAVGQPDVLSARIARNTQIILQEESSLSAVLDPAGGSWYVENLTEAYAEAAWKAFQELQSEGGMARALSSGAIATKLAEAWATRQKNLARRKDAVTGVSEFPNIAEDPVVREAVDPKQAKAEAAARVSAGAAVELPPAGTGARAEAAVKAALAGASIGQLSGLGAVTGPTQAALPRHRYAEDFEALRDASDAALASSGSRPKIFLCNLGNVAAHTARATFAKNYFEAGGIDASAAVACANPEAAKEAFAKSGAQIAVLCSSDKQYEQDVKAFAPALKEAGAKTLYLAGRAGAQEAEYRAAGVDDFIFAGGQVLDQLKAALKTLGV